MVKSELKPRQTFQTLNDKFEFGQYKGEYTLGDVIDKDPQYILWIHANSVAFIPVEYVAIAGEIASMRRSRNEDIFMKFIDDEPPY